MVLRVRDTGIGMTEKDIETALKPFRQLSATTGRSARRRAPASACRSPRRWSEANRASFSIKSTPNGGTLAEISFPSTRVLAG